MKTWKQFKLEEPKLLRIEQRFTKLQNFERKCQQLSSGAGLLDIEDIKETREVILESIRAEAGTIQGKIYYWLYPFYAGNFLQLVAALGHCGLMEKQKDDAESRNAFYGFFRTVPVEERLQLGARLNHPELTQQSIQIQQKIQAKKDALKSHLNSHHAN
ncbi:MAG: hypothetical protein SF052_21900 [Bacteroidia bacterium]|nr:hypothetical protein [Bacteroidia bacterium]